MTPSALSDTKSGREEEGGEASQPPGSGGWAGRPARPPPTTVQECHCILLPCRHLDDSLFVSSPLVMDNHISKQMQQAILGHNRRDSGVLGRGRCNRRTGKGVLLHKRRELCQSNSGTIRSGFLCFIILEDFYRGRPLAAQTTWKGRDCIGSHILFTLPTRWVDTTK
jgi:hypothetical protein